MLFRVRWIREVCSWFCLVLNLFLYNVGAYGLTSLKIVQSNQKTIIIHQNCQSSFGNLVQTEIIKIQFMEATKKEEQKPSQSQQSVEQTSQQKIALLQKTLNQYDKFFQNYLKSVFMCTISHDLMIDPVIVSSGQTFERSSICDSIRLRGLVCPNTRLPLKKQQAKPQNLIPNVSIRGLIKEYKQFLERTDPQKLRQLLTVTQTNRITISEYQKANANLDIDPVKKILRHSYKKVDMRMFLKCDWRQIMEMDLTQCEVDDKGIQLMLQNADKLFPKLIQIDLRCNLIHEIKNLQRFKKLRRINLQHNPLSKQTIKYLKSIANSKLRIKL